ncbi:MAG: non-ribosomal peptide synthetase [Planctomycetota bacterium]|nr:MAG: non-ribosomal peptide synthetase [Planctomycetota bacterium]
MTQQLVQSAIDSEDAYERVFVLPASFAQQRMWFLNELWPDAGVYNVPLVLRLDGPLDLDRLQASLDALILRHESLRTNLRWDESGVVQLIRSPRPCRIERIEFADHAPEARRRELALREAERFVQRPFRLASDAPLRVQLIRCGPQEWVLALVMHHAFCDEWSWSLLLREFAHLMGPGQWQERFGSLPPTHLQYGDYAVWQRDMFETGRLQADLQYWQRVFATPPELLALPTDRPRPSVQSFAGDHCSFEIDAATTAGLRAVGGQMRSTLFVVLQAAYAILLHRYTGQSDLTIGCPVSGRNRPELETVVGLFLNTLPIRIHPHSDMLVHQLITHVRSVSLDAHAHAELPFDRLVEELAVARDASRSPLFQTVMTFQAEPALPPQIPGMNVEFADVSRGIARFDIALYIEDRGERLMGEFEYNTALFDRPTIERLMRHFQSLLAGLPLHLDAPIGHLPLLTPKEMAFELHECNSTTLPWPDDDLSQLFRQHAKERAAAGAVSDRDGPWTYRDLFHHVELARQRLQRAGVGASDRVAVQLGRRKETVAWLLAVWELGAAFVPIDPAFPAARREYILRHSRPQFLLLDTASPHPGFEFSGTCLCIGADSGDVESSTCELSRGSERLEGRDATWYDQELPAYILYTSGSTGQPKGVVIPRRAVKNFLLSMQRCPGYEQSDCLLAITTFSFDISILELFLPLACGGRFYLADRSDGMDGHRLAQLIETVDATCLQATPSTWQLLLESGWAGKADLKMLCGGEALSAELARQLLHRGGELWNMYGPTETTVWSSVQRITEQELDRITIGRPIANTQMYVLNDAQQPQPVGVPGNLFIAGAGVGLGYFGNPEETAQRFRENPFLRGTTMYDTGDTAVRHPDGRLEYVGRRDGQVKLRGYRIETGEIESALEAMEAVRQAVVVVRAPRGTGGSSSDARLVAYVRWEDATRPISPTELRRRLAERLPDYMLPAQFVTLEAFPQTANRKVDRGALPEPGTDILAGEAAGRPPSTPRERQLAGIWGEVLGMADVPVDRDFFELGGNSLAAARMMNRVANQLGRRLPLALLLSASTIEQLASRLSQEGWVPEWQLLVPLRESGTRQPLFCVHAAGGNVLLYRELVRAMDPQRPVFGIQSDALEGDSPRAKTVEEMARQYIAAIKQMQPTGPYHLCGYCLGGTIAYEMAQQLCASGDRVGSILLFDTHARWQRLPLWAELYTLYQKIAFHAGNLLLSGPRGMLGFLREKALEARRRINRRLAVTRSHIAYRLGRQSHPPIRLLEKYYDDATENYRPLPYPGKVIVFKPRAPYVGYTDPSMGWGDLVADLEIVPLDVFPAGMLMPPFVQQLAQEVDRRLEDEG